MTLIPFALAIGFSFIIAVGAKCPPRKPIIGSKEKI